MNLCELFLQRYSPLYEFWLAGIWDTVPEELMRVRPHPRVNSIAWNLWHLTRAEDSGLNRFVADRAQVLDEGPWLQAMNIPWRHNGCEMTFAEVDELDQCINLAGLHAYAQAVEARTREIVAQLDQIDLDVILDEERLRRILFAEELAHPRAAGLLANYLGWTAGKALMNLGLTHSYQHVGEIGVIASLLGMEFE